ncbi:hypothetical protein, partial [Neoaquamicrobium sediminum]|uniref:hypothetical protein n=1 Tax=Neoaquamicrobium sediminum TaxID=1849104 RepID=UPI004036F6B8
MKKINSCCAVARNLSLHSSLHSSHRATAQPPLIFKNMLSEKYVFLSANYHLSKFQPDRTR